MYSVCFEKENYFEDYNICKVLQLSFSDWRRLTDEMYKNFSDQMESLPKLKPKHIIMRVCRRLGVRRDEERAMVEMCERIQANGNFDFRINTIAAMAFWKVLEYSTKYANKYPLGEVCKSHDKMQEDGMRISEIQKCFDITPDNVRKVFKDKIQVNFLERYLPNWEGRKALAIDSQHKEEDYS